MKKSILLLPLLALCLGFMPIKAQRYLTEIFSSYQMAPDVTYGANITVITGSPALDTLMADVYMPPASDTLMERPVICMAHTGSFLPVPLNGQCTGTRKDSTITWMARQFAMRGFVVVNFSYRLGWNPAGSQEVRTGTLLNAAYRGIQDSWTLTRWLKETVLAGNPYGVDTTNIVMGGAGTGGYIGFGAAYLDSYDEINLVKFLDPNNGNSYVDTSLSGDIYGEWQRPLNVPNHLGHTNEISMAFNLGGAVGDSSWVEAGEPASVSFACPTDPFAPFDFGAVIVPTTGDFVVNVSGSRGVARMNNGFGNNDGFATVGLSDPYTMAAQANANNQNNEGLFAFNRPPPEGSPWDFWDTTACPATLNASGLQTNPDMSMMKAMTYIDTVMGYLVPRIVCGTGLAECALISSTDEELPIAALTIYPNPSNGILHVESNVGGNAILSINMIDLQGRIVMTQEGINDLQHSFEADGLSPGLYFMQVETRKGMLTKKVILE